MNNNILTYLNPGCRATVTGLKNKDSMRRRLQDMGVIEGTNIECVMKSPGGDPKAYLIRGAVVAIRSEDSDNILIEM